MRDGWEARTALLGLALGVVLGLVVGAIRHEVSSRADPVSSQATTYVPPGADAPLVRVVSEVCGGSRWGSGAVLGDGTILTNRHVVAGATDVTVELGDRTIGSLDVRVSPGADVARLSVGRDATAGWPAPEIGRMVIGEPVVVSSAHGVTNAAVVEARRGLGPADPATAWVLDAPALSGMSGAAVHDGDGRLVGVVYAAEHRSGRALVIPAADALGAATTPMSPTSC